VGVFGGLGLLLGVLWLLVGGLTVLGLYWLLWMVLSGAGLRYGLTKPSRACPRCGKRVEVGKLDRDTCGFDFQQIGSTPKPV
jgi:hypothetical protein